LFISQIQTFAVGKIYPLIEIFFDCQANTFATGPSIFYMKKKTLITFLVLLILLLSFGYIFFIPRSYYKEFKTPYPAIRAAEQFNSVNKMANWYVPFAGQIQDSAFNAREIRNSEASLTIIDQSLYSSIIKTVIGSKEKEFSIAAMPDTSNKEGSVITLFYKSTLYNKWFAKKKLIRNALLSFDNLKELYEDTKKFYGYTITIVPVTDTSFLFTRVTVPFSQKKEATVKIFNDLIAYADQHNAGYTGARIFHSIESETEITLFASIGVSNMVQPHESSPFEYKNMPLGKNLLEATYQGPYGEVEKVYTALQKFKSDHGLTSMAIPFQKFLTDGYSFDDDQIVQLKVYYPVF
jgi:effector-binding domain-containing protein